MSTKLQRDFKHKCLECGYITRKCICKKLDIYKPEDMDSFYRMGMTLKLFKTPLQVDSKHYGMAQALMLVKKNISFFKDTEFTNLNLVFNDRGGIFYFTTIQRINSDRTMCRHWTIYIEQDIINSNKHHYEKL